MTDSDGRSPGEATPTGDAMDPETVLDLQRRWHDGDRAALAELVQKNLPWIHAQVRKRLDAGLRRKLDSVDMVQDAVVQVLENGPRFEIANQGHFRALVARIVANDIHDRHRWMKRERRDAGREGPVASDSVLKLDEPVKDVTRPSETIDRNERQAWVRLAIQLLDPEDRLAVRMRQWDQASFAEIGERLGISEDAARMRHNRALRRLAEKVIDLRSGSIARFLRDDV